MSSDIGVLKQSPHKTPPSSQNFSLCDKIFNDFCIFIVDKKINHIEEDTNKQAGLNPSSLTIYRQKVLIQSCLLNIIYSENCRCISYTKQVISTHISEFDRILRSSCRNELISIASTVLKSYAYKINHEYKAKQQAEGTNIPFDPNKPKRVPRTYVRQTRSAIGSARNRQYYHKKIADVLSGPLPSSNTPIYLYKFDMVLIRPISIEQNRRGRRIVDPCETNQNFAIVTPHLLPRICPFPLFTRSGEVRIYLRLVCEGTYLSETSIDKLKKFHEFTFSKVLRLEKYPIQFDPDNSPFAVLLTPVNEIDGITDIDWDFVGKIVYSNCNSVHVPPYDERKDFVFKYEDYQDAVVIPWYRVKESQECAYYVAQICPELNPNSTFPDDLAGFDSFKSYYVTKYNITVNNMEQPILDVDHTSARLNLLTPRYVNRKGVTLLSSAAKTDQDDLAQKQLLIPELCSIHPFPASFWRKAECLPSIFHRLNSLFLAEELRCRVNVGLKKPNEDFEWEPLDFGWLTHEFHDISVAKDLNPTFGELLPDHDLRLMENQLSTLDTSTSWKNISFDPTMNELNSVGPSPSILLSALTMSNASDGVNLERLETVGDSFLKYSITAYLYLTHPTLHEGKLSKLRSSQISNKNLYELGKSKNLGELMSATKFEPNDNWLAPCYSNSSTLNKDRNNESYNNKKRAIDEALAEVPYDLLSQHSIADKTIADCVEALIGAYLTSSGARAALLFMHWVGFDVIPNIGAIQLSEQKQANNPETPWRWLDLPTSPLIIVPLKPEKSVIGSKLVPKERLQSSESIKLLDSESVEAAFMELKRHFYDNHLSEFEQLIGYSFKDKSFLVQAFTHNTYFLNRVTDCYQRLEFLGDAILDYVITRYLYEDPRCHSPGALTDLRSALVNNSFFASLAVKYSFHKYLKHISDDLKSLIEGFVLKFENDSEMTTKGHTLLITEGESENAEDVEVPKPLGDVFESVAGAIYLDSGMSLDEVWRVYFRMMKPEIEYFSTNVPKSPIRELLESMPQKVCFSPSELVMEGKYRVIAEVFSLGFFTGVGRHRHSAKNTAAKRALRALHALNARQISLDDSCYVKIIWETKSVLDDMINKICAQND